MNLKLLPTDAELNILQILWKLGPCTVRQVFEALGSRGAYTTVLTIMKIMSDKGLLDVDKSAHTYVYTAAMPSVHIRHLLIDDLIARAFAGNAPEFVLQALTFCDNAYRPAELKAHLKAIRKRVSEMEKKYAH